MERRGTRALGSAVLGTVVLLLAANGTCPQQEGLDARLQELLTQFFLQADLTEPVSLNKKKGGVPPPGLTQPGEPTSTVPAIATTTTITIVPSAGIVSISTGTHGNFTVPAAEVTVRRDIGANFYVSGSVRGAFGGVTRTVETSTAGTSTASAPSGSGLESFQSPDRGGGQIGAPRPENDRAEESSPGFVAGRARVDESVSEMSAIVGFGAKASLGLAEFSASAGVGVSNLRIGRQDAFAPTAGVRFTLRLGPLALAYEHTRFLNSTRFGDVSENWAFVGFQF